MKFCNENSLILYIERAMPLLCLLEARDKAIKPIAVGNLLSSAKSRLYFLIFNKM